MQNPPTEKARFAFLVVLVSIIAGLAMVVASTCAKAADTQTYFAAMNREVMVLDWKGNAICAGTVIASDGHTEDILTAKHCSTDEGPFAANPTHVEWFGQLPEPIVGILRDPDSDLAIFEVHSEALHDEAASIANGFVPGETVFEIGDPDGNEWMESDARVMASDRFGMLELNYPTIWYGDSGGAVWNEDGNVVGVVVWKDPKITWLAYAVPSSEVLRFLYANGATTK